MKAYKATQALYQLCKQFGIDEFAVTDASPFNNIEYTHCPQLEGFLEKDAERRLTPTLTMKEARSIICFLFPYKKRGGASNNFSPDKAQGKIISGDVWLEEDYHKHILKKLRLLCSGLEAQFGGRYMPFCDTGPLLDKEVAVRCGLCEYGRNSLALSAAYGSYFYIGYIITDLLFEDSINIRQRKHSDLCQGCNKCITACPTGALRINMPMDYEKCASFITQKKGDLSNTEARSIGGSLYGCHVCQSVCPANAKYKDTDFIKYVDLDNLNISNKEFERKFSNSAAGFLRKKRFVRNSLAILENKNKRG